jgi:hypothetical protein
MHSRQMKKKTLDWKISLVCQLVASVLNFSPFLCYILSICSFHYYVSDLSQQIFQNERSSACIESRATKKLKFLGGLPNWPEATEVTSSLADTDPPEKLQRRGERILSSSMNRTYGSLKSPLRSFGFAWHNVQRACLLGAFRGRSRNPLHLSCNFTCGERSFVFCPFLGIPRCYVCGLVALASVCGRHRCLSRFFHGETRSSDALHVKVLNRRPKSVVDGIIMGICNAIGACTGMFCDPGYGCC